MGRASAITPAGDRLALGAGAAALDRLRGGLVAAHRRLDAARAEYERVTHGQRYRRRDRESKYLLPGFGRCAMCRGGMHVRSRSHWQRRAFFYACTSHYDRDPEVCPHVEQWPTDAIDHAVLAAIAGDVLKPDLVAEVLAAAKEIYLASSKRGLSERRYPRARVSEREQGRLTEALAAGADVPVRSRAAEDDGTTSTGTRGTTRGPSPEGHSTILARNRTPVVPMPRRLAVAAHGRRGDGAAGVSPTADDADSVHTIHRKRTPQDTV